MKNEEGINPQRASAQRKIFYVLHVRQAHNKERVLLRVPFGTSGHYHTTTVEPKLEKKTP